MKRFKIGDRARIVKSSHGHEGCECTITGYDPISDIGTDDYDIEIDGFPHPFDGWTCMDWQLEPIKKHETGSWEKLESLGWTRPEIKTKELAKD